VQNRSAGLAAPRPLNGKAFDGRTIHGQLESQQLGRFSMGSPSYSLANRRHLPEEMYVADVDGADWRSRLNDFLMH
jgi:hypothetical protein